MLYKGVKGVNVAARLPKGGPGEAGGLSATSLPSDFNARPVRMPDDPAKKPGRKAKMLALTVQKNV